MDADQVRSVAGTELGNYFFAINDQYVGSAMTTVMSALLCTSLFASPVAVAGHARHHGRQRRGPGDLRPRQPRPVP
ncbi:hypothetical protein ACFXAZ_36855 [Streptomyces sp. NPDC059477]|uniref:hypothetical protein n=1 Tax=Streptomyces sp. NPDC059477 TaxID=3346847 RepID=UPI0036C7456D